MVARLDAKAEPVALLNRIKTQLLAHIADADQFDDITLLAARQQMPAWKTLLRSRR